MCPNSSAIKHAKESTNMSINHPENQSKVDNLPDHDNVAVPDQQFQFDEEQGLSAQRLGERAQENPGHLRAFVVGGVVTAIVAAGGYLGIKSIGGGEDGNAKSPAPTPDTTSSSSANPVETKNVGPVSATELVGTPEANSFDTVNVKPSQEVIDQALKGVPVSEFETPQEAFVELSNIYNVFELSGEVDDYIDATTESKSLGKDLLGSLYTSKTLKDGQFAQENLVRSNLGFALQSVNEIKTTPDGPLTWRNDFTVDSIDQTGDVFTVDATNVLQTNFGATEGLDFSNMIKNVDQSKAGLSVTVEMVKEDGQWRWSSYTTN